jgi:hypothetical protein
MATVNGYLYAFNLTSTAPGFDFQTSTYCYPNPARGNVSHIQVFVARAATMKMTIFNAAEKPVVKVTRAFFAGEKYAVDWDLLRVANGVYFALIKVKYTDGTSESKLLKVAVLR